MGSKYTQYNSSIGMGTMITGRDTVSQLSQETCDTTIEKNQPTPEEAMQDKRMRWILNLEGIEKKPWYWMEYEVASEGFITGLFQHGNGSILCGALDFSPDQSGLYHYLLKIKTAEWDKPENDSKKGYAFREGVVGELLTLFSLFFRRRFYLVSSYYGELTDHSLRVRTAVPFVRMPCHLSLHPHVFSKDQEDWEGPVNRFLESVKCFDAKCHPQFILAANHYARALREIGIDQEMVFIRLVSSVEALSSFYISLTKNEDGLYDTDVDSLFKEDISSELKKELKNIIEVRKAKTRFIRFIEDYSKNYPQFPEQGSLTKIGPKYLRKRLSAIYGARSDYLHSGLPMYLSTLSAAFPEWDIDPSVGQIIDRRFLPESKKLPNVWWFDGIVRYCLLRFLDTHQRTDKNFNVDR